MPLLLYDTLAVFLNPISYRKDRKSLDIVPEDLFDLSTQSFLQTLVFILENFNEYGDTNRQEETKTPANGAQTELQETQIPDEEILANKYEELREEYNSLQNLLEQITSLFRHLSGNGEDLTVTLSEVIESLSDIFSSSDSNQENSHNFLLSLVELITQMIGLLNEKNSLMEKLQGRVNYLNRQLFGKKSEKEPFTEEDEPCDDEEEEPEQLEETDTNTETPIDEDEEIVEDEKEAETYEEKWRKNKKEHEKKKRGAKKGHKGYGRKILNGLPIEEIIIKTPEEQMYCPRCGAHFQLINSYSTFAP